MELRILSYPKHFNDECKIITSLMERYDFIFHLRKPGASVEVYNQYLKCIPSYLHRRIVLHDAYELKDLYALKGLHFSVKNRSQASDIICKGKKSTSCHSIEEVRQLDGVFEDIFLSPVFPGISKQGYKGDLNMEEVKQFLKQGRQSNIIALGGIDQHKIKQLNDCFFDGIAVLGAVWTLNPGNAETIQENIDQIVHNVCACMTK
ncbi:MAG: thiamine phosphate synthase [Bacteroidota bacterium]